MNAVNSSNGSAGMAQLNKSARMAGRLALGAVALAAMATVAPIHANTIPIANYNFAAPATGPGGYTTPISNWVSGGPGGVGVQNFQNGTGQFSSSSLTAYNAANGGYQAAYVIAGNTPTPIIQDVTTTDGASWQANTTYSLTVLMGQRLDFAPSMSGFMELISGTLSGSTISNGVVEASKNNLTSNLGDFTSYSIQFTTGATAPVNDLIIELGNNTPPGDNQVEFGDVQLTAVPEPVSLGLLAVGGLGLVMVKRRRMT